MSQLRDGSRDWRGNSESAGDAVPEARMDDFYSVWTTDEGAPGGAAGETFPGITREDPRYNSEDIVSLLGY